jgi:hypothetical protein
LVQPVQVALDYLVIWTKIDLPMNRSRTAFTLIEIILAITIAVVVLAMAVPALTDAIGGKGLDATFTDFDNFVRKSRQRAVSERRDFLLVWQKEGITFEPTVPNAQDDEAAVEMYGFGDASIAIERPYALSPKPPAEWPLWRSGSCEPVRIYYDGPLGRWTAEYDALSGRGNLVDLEAK